MKLMVFPLMWWCWNMLEPCWNCWGNKMAIIQILDRPSGPTTELLQNKIFEVPDVYRFHLSVQVRHRPRMSQVPNDGLRRHFGTSRHLLCTSLILLLMALLLVVVPLTALRRGQPSVISLQLSKLSEGNCNGRSKQCRQFKVQWSIRLHSHDQLRSAHSSA